MIVKISILFLSVLRFIFQQICSPKTSNYFYKFIYNIFLLSFKVCRSCSFGPLFFLILLNLILFSLLALLRVYQGTIFGFIDIFMKYLLSVILVFAFYYFSFSTFWQFYSPFFFSPRDYYYESLYSLKFSCQVLKFPLSIILATSHKF